MSSVSAIRQRGMPLSENSGTRLNGAIGGTNVGACLFRNFDLHTTTVQGTAGYSVPLNASATLSLSATAGAVISDHGVR